MIDNFSHDLWSNVQNLFEQNCKDEALYMLFNELRIEAFEKQNYSNCDVFLNHLLFEQNYIDTDSIVHILNILSDVKEHLYHWDTFVARVTILLEEREGPEVTKTLLKVVL